jgi:hypothetical protein
MTVNGRLAADIARCAGENCPQREHCLRYTTPPMPDHPRQAWVCPPEGIETGRVCEFFIPGGTPYGDDAKTNSRGNVVEKICPKEEPPQ